MSTKLLQVAVWTVLLTAVGVWGAPFFSEEEDNQFLRLKRHVPYLQDYWDPSSSRNAWGYNVVEQASESWTALKRTAQYYMDLGPFADTARDRIESYMNMFRNTGTHLEQQTRQDN